MASGASPTPKMVWFDVCLPDALHKMVDQHRHDGLVADSDFCLSTYVQANYSLASYLLCSPFVLFEQQLSSCR
jgi:hypothetical protein